MEQPQQVAGHGESADQGFPSAPHIELVEQPQQIAELVRQGPPQPAPHMNHLVQQPGLNSPGNGKKSHTAYNYSFL